MDVHNRQSGHDERSERADIDRRIDRLKDPDNKLFQFRIADHDLGVARTADHPGIPALERNDLDAFVHFLHILAGLFVGPVGQAVKSVGEPAMNIRVVDIVESLECRNTMPS